MQDRFAHSIIALAVSLRSHKLSMQAEGDTANAMILRLLHFD